MKSLQDYSEEIYKCTKCGLCQTACPIFNELGLESVVSRGKFTLLNGLVSGQLKLNKNLTKYFDLCLTCKACNDFCPSGINTDEIIIAARHAGYKLNNMPLIKKIVLFGLSSNINMTLAKHFLNLYKISNISSSKILNNLTKENIKYKKLTPVKSPQNLKIAYFPGCINSYVNPSVKNAVIMVLEKNGFNVDIPEGLSCCGMALKNSGDFKNFIKSAKNNINKIDFDIDYLIMDCASCGAAWQKYDEFLDNESSKKARIIKEKIININKFLTLFDIYIPDKEQDIKTVTYHDPCHLKRSQGVHEEPRKILNSLPGIKYVELNDADKCCGAAGTFCLTNPEVSKAISRKKAENILNTEADIVATSCSGCKVGLSQGLSQVKSNIEIYQPVELLAKLYLLGI